MQLTSCCQHYYAPKESIIHRIALIQGFREFGGDNNISPIKIKSIVPYSAHLWSSPSHVMCRSAPLSFRQCPLIWMAHVHWNSIETRPSDHEVHDSHGVLVLPRQVVRRQRHLLSHVPTPPFLIIGAILFLLAIVVDRINALLAGVGGWCGQAMHDIFLLSGNRPVKIYHGNLCDHPWQINQDNNRHLYIHHMAENQCN